MKNPDTIEKVLDYYFHPYFPSTIYNGEIETSLSLNYDESFLDEKNLKKIIEILNYHGILKETIAPEVGEILATQVLDYNISNRISRHQDSKSKLVKVIGKSGYNINSSEEYIAKITHGHNVVILKKGKNKDKTKFNFNVAAEIDGLYMIKRYDKKTQKNTKVFYAIETKTGTTSMSKEHIYEDIIIPLKKMYNTEINYIMIGFPDRMYKDEKNQIFNNNIQNIYNYLQEKDIKFFPLTFPFNENKFSNFVTQINKQRMGWDISKYTMYNEKENIVKMILSDGREIYGKIEPIK